MNHFARSRSSCDIGGAGSRRSRGFTLVELLVVIAIIGVLVGMTIPAVQGLRELSRRASCNENLTRMSFALSAYHMEYGHYPAGTINPEGPIRSEPVGFHHNWISGLLPMLEAQNVYEAIDQSVSVYAEANEPVRQLQLPFLRCPSAPSDNPTGSTYAGSHHPTETPIDVSNQGVFFLNETLSDEEIPDGLSYTLFVGEKVQDFGMPLSWISGTRATLRNAGHPINAHRTVPSGGFGPEFQAPLFVGGFSSWHAQGANFLTGGGKTQFLSDSIDLKILQQMANRADGQIPVQWQVGVAEASLGAAGADAGAEVAGADDEAGEADEADEADEAVEADGDNEAEPNGAENEDANDA